MHTTTLALCESPLQLINSICYLKKTDQINKSFFFIRLNGCLKNDNLIRDLVKENKIKYCFFIVKPKSKLKVLFIHLAVIKKLKLSPIENVIIGDLRSKWMINKISLGLYKNITLIFVDDGLATINNYKKAESLQLKLKNKIIYYTSLKLKSEFIEIKEQTKERTLVVPDNSMLFIGSPLIEKKITTESQYVEVLLKITEMNNKYKPLVYCLHRSESYLTDQMIKSLGFDSVLDLDLSLESAIESGIISPGKITGLYSTALVNVEHLFSGIKVVAYMPDDIFFSKPNLENILQVYSYIYNHTSIKVKKIELRHD